MSAALGLAVAVGSGCVAPSACTPVKIAPGIYQGCKPTTPRDFAALHKEGIRTILSLETMIVHLEPERQLARKNGFRFINVPILPSPLPPSEQRVKEALVTLRQCSLYPIFIHCYIGVDRTTFVTGLYRVYYLGWTPQAAWQDMLRAGFHPRWWLFGFKTYFWHHTSVPAWTRNMAPSGAGKKRAMVQQSGGRRPAARPRQTQSSRRF